jgi:lipoprotein-anchoring transpeptidase ErfK/SrfK
MNRRQALTALAVGASGVLAACAGNAVKGQPEAQGPPPAPEISYKPDIAATDVVPTSQIGINVNNGWFQRVTLSNAEGKPVAGVINRDRTSFTTTEPLGYGVVYSWGGAVVGRDGKAVPLAGSFTTVTPQTQVNGQFQLADGQVVGVAVPIIMQFDTSISDKASVEKAMKVTTTPPVEGSWAWLPDEVGGSRVHWRTRDYYPAGTKVHVAANLYGIPFGEGAFGAQDLTLDFEIGRRQVVKAEASSHQIEVITDAGVIMTLPCSYGEADLPRNITRSGIHVVTEKYEDFYMTNPAAGYSNVHERFAVRISNNGEFIHANPSSAGAQGNTNVTNGCINLSTSDAQHRDLRRPGGGHGYLDRAVLRRRRHLGLGHKLGRVEGHVGRHPGAVAVEPAQHGSCHPDRRANALGHADDDHADDDGTDHHLYSGYDVSGRVNLRVALA